ncbi:MAG TPA: hypothetical protein PK909_05565 [Sphaerochaeta sp.]|jgi:chromosome segregation ATPase|nr:MAG: hypothetical protein BWY50_02132 [Spirochaetes bacterium ADurb.Bin315]HPX28152.1 hypothetical protein [Sphaerochaeta sp.]HQB54929.1 hypothetical protein [Sphaerochaeta sp.]
MGFEIILSLLLFVITLIIIVLLRAEDKRSHSLEVMKNRMGQFIKEIDATRSLFREEMQNVEERLNWVIDEARRGSEALSARLSEIDRRRSELVELESILARYRNALLELGETTLLIDRKIEEQKTWQARIDEIHAQIDEFDFRLQGFASSFERALKSAYKAMEEPLLT